MYPNVPGRLTLLSTPSIGVPNRDRRTAAPIGEGYRSDSAAFLDVPRDLALNAPRRHSDNNYGRIHTEEVRQRVSAREYPPRR